MKDIIGLAVLAWPLTLLVLIALTSLVVIPLAVGYAKRTGRSKWSWGIGAFLLVYLPIFWDWIPTVAVYQYYCAKESGFWVYKTLDQWKAENPGVMEALVSNKGQVRNFTGDLNNFTRTGFMNQRFLYITKHQGPMFLNRWRKETEIVDDKNKEVLAREVDFSTSQERRQAGYSGWKFWLDSRQCSNHSHRDSGSISTIANQIEGGAK